ncbi:putative cytochrome p450 protein [Botrytis fragariae]|uniref:Putative cytochrome p450 protein n=1 Tax=Botrytis fragariae TaxID=1964551 RepID=A0A8H6B638_9HELO|nr:putative cytochrome p450 protein [Botrytis fragariae]KAF5879687.1 putative cytochrome p450 protein [Botrytis fragariae]
MLGIMEAAVDILEKAGETFSSRPHFIMGPQVAPKVKPMQINESAILMHDYLTKEGSSKQHKILRRYTASLMFYMGYGRRVTSLDDPLCVAHDQEEEFNHIRTMASKGVLIKYPYFPSTKVPGQFSLESWPMLLWLPHPLQWFRHEPEKHQDTNTRLYTTAMNEAAGIGTTTTALEIAILAMLHYPECLQRVKAEIDAVVGKDRMPIFEDQQSLPYLGAFIRETLRWRLVTLAGIAYSSTQGYTYKGMLIPKDASVYANAAEIMKDPAVFPEGEKFIPERFWETGVILNYRFGCFGFGRRMCPGMHVELQSMYIVIARLIWAYDVLPVTINGNPYIPDKNDFTYGLVSYPANLKFQLVPRSEKHREIIIADA